MAGMVAAEAGALQTGQRAVRDAYQSISAEIGHVRDLTDQLDCWSGDAGDKYRELVTRWQERAKGINDRLINLEDQLKQTEQAQIRDETSHQQATSGIASMMA